MAATNDNLHNAPPQRTVGRFELLFMSLDDGRILRTGFYALLLTATAVLGADLRGMLENDARDADIPAVIVPQTGLPAAAPAGPDGSDNARAAPALLSDPDAMRGAMRFALVGGGVLRAEGTIGFGSAKQFAAEVAARGEYITTVWLDSPGGSVTDALEMSELIREKGFATQVDDGRLCASSCPIVFAGGKQRFAGAQAAIGVHQIFAAAEPGEKPSPAAAMAQAQTMSAAIARHLTAMGIAPELWLHAMETPKEQLFYLTPKALKETGLATKIVSAKG